MNPQDLKRLIAGFLAFSVITSTATLIFLNFAGKPKPQQEALQVKGENPLTTVNKDAFVESLPSSTRGAAAQSAYSDNPANSSNLTQNFAVEFARQIIGSNPNGPQLDSAGNPTLINLPSSDDATNAVLRAIASTSINITANIKNSDLKIKNSYSADDVIAYSNTINNILGSVVSSTDALGISSGNFTSNTLSLGQLIFNAAEAKLKATPVPRKFLDMHKALVAFFANQNNVLQIASNYQNDPLKSIIVLKSDGKIVDRDLSKLTSEFNKVKPDLLSYDEGGDQSESLIENVFGVRIAHAQYVVSAPILDSITGLNWAKNFADEALKWAMSAALQALKNQLIGQLQNQIVSWIAGNGKPKFITDWSGFLSDVANNAAGEAISKISQQACTGFGPILQRILYPVPYADTSVRCTLTQVISNTNAFFDSFKNGTWYQTWTGYGALLRPTNNFFGQVILGNDQVAMAQMNAQQSANSEAIADKGFLPVKKCVAYGDVGVGNEAYRRCTEWVNTTPGALVGDALVKAVGWPADTVINANDISGLVSAIVNASINKIITVGLSSLTPSNTSAASYSSGGVSQSVSTNLGYAVSSIGQTGVFQQNQIIITADTQWLGLGTAASSNSTISLLNQLSASCPPASGQANQRIADVNAMAQTVQAELDKANSLANLSNEAAAATSTEDITNLINQIQAIDITAITNTATKAQQHLASLQYFTSLVQQNIQAAQSTNTYDTYGECAAPLPSITVIPPPPTVLGG